MTDTPRALLLEGIHPTAKDILGAAGIHDIAILPGALKPDALIEALKGVELVGIRSATQITADVIARAPNLRAIGCFCIGTNQVDLDAAEARGIPVFNAPFANSRSVAELTLASMIMLMRGVPAKSCAIMRGEWIKSAKGSYEVRGKKLGIIGYGNIGSQLSVLASGLGIHVYYYDIEAKLAHGNARAVPSLDALLEIADVVTLHVPSTDQTRGMINAAAIAKMKPESFLINHARGDLVDIDALSAALASGHIAGAAIDVFPVEPKSREEAFVSPLRLFENTILTPHIGGSTEEAQKNIGLEVAEKLGKLIGRGSTGGAVNFPEVSPGPVPTGRTRLVHTHKNVPGVLSRINDSMARRNVNIASQWLATSANVGYAVIDMDGEGDVSAIAADLSGIDATISLRLIER
jgi:D-3-phosphoglycerate dehydrogenase / 2-oxoglutarate reductase